MWETKAGLGQNSRGRGGPRGGGWGAVPTCAPAGMRLEDAVGGETTQQQRRASQSVTRPSNGKGPEIYSDEVACLF